MPPGVAPSPPGLPRREAAPEGRAELREMRHSRPRLYKRAIAATATQLPLVDRRGSQAGWGGAPTTPSTWPPSSGVIEKWEWRHCNGDPASTSVQRP